MSRLVTLFRPFSPALIIITSDRAGGALSGVLCCQHAIVLTAPLQRAGKGLRQ